MIRKLVEADREKVVAYLSEEPSINLFALGDIENFGFDNPKQDVWGQFDGEELIGVLLRYRENYIPYYKLKEVDRGPFKDIIFKAALAKDIFVSGRESILKDFDGLLKGYKYRPTYFCELNSDEALIDGSSYEIKIAKPEDAERIYELISTIDEFTADLPAENYRKKIEENSGRIYYVENEDGRMDTVVQTTAECSIAAMIVGVATRKESRGKGMMSACLSKMCKDLLSDGKTLCLFYDNPNAGKVYHKLGFKSIDQWVMISNK